MRLLFFLILLLRLPFPSFRLRHWSPLFFVRCGGVVRCLLGLFLACSSQLRFLFLGFYLFLRGFSSAIPYASSFLRALPVLSLGSGWGAVDTCLLLFLSFACTFFGGFSSFFDFPDMLRIPLARCAVYPSLVRFPLPLPRPSRLVFIGIPFPFGNFPGFSCSSFSALALSGLSSTSCYCLFSCRVFCITCASSGSPGFRGFLLGFLGHYRLSSTSSTAIHFFPLSCSPLGSFPRLSSSSIPFRVFFCLTRLPGSFVLALFFSSVLLSFSASVVPSLGAVTCAWYVCTLDISPVPHSFLAMPVDRLRVWLIFIFLYRLLISRLPLAILFMAPRPLCLRSFSFVMAFPPVVPP